MGGGRKTQVLGRGGIAAVTSATGILSKRIRMSMRELSWMATRRHPYGTQSASDSPAGAGRKQVTDPTLLRDLESLIDPVTRGDPESPGGRPRAFETSPRACCDGPPEWANKKVGSCFMNWTTAFNRYAKRARASETRCHVSFYRASDLVRALTEARDTRVLSRLQERLRRVALLIVDELGFVPFEKAGGELLFDVLSTRHERGATIMTSNLAFSEWNRVFVDDKLTAALLDRLAQHADVLVTRGPGDRGPATAKRSDPKEDKPA